MSFSIHSEKPSFSIDETMNMAVLSFCPRPQERTQDTRSFHSYSLLHLGEKGKKAQKRVA